MAAEAIADDIPNERVKTQYSRIFAKNTAHLVRGECLNEPPNELY
jgi:hypothetical protein